MTSRVQLKDNEDAGTQSTACVTDIVRNVFTAAISTTRSNTTLHRRLQSVVTEL